MAERTCFNCLYCCCDPCLWLRLLSWGEPILPQCANHPQWPGQLHEVPGVPCRNYRPRPATPRGDGVRMIPLTDGCYAYVDAADYEWLNQWAWHLEDGYALRCDKGKRGKRILMHRQIMQPAKGMVVDHIDGNKANNCRVNLRVCTCSENSRNHRKRSDSFLAYKGVFYDKRRHKWGARCQYRRDRIWLGYFDNEVEAARAYDRKAVELFGEFARLNFPREWPPQRRAEVYTQRQEKRDEASGARGERSEWVPKRDRSRLGSQSRLQAGKTSPTRGNAELPTPNPQAPGRSARAKGKKEKTPARAGTRGHTKKGKIAERNEKKRKKV
jgi:hypothetical protein